VVVYDDTQLSFFEANLKLDDIDDLYDPSTQTYTYVISYEDISAGNAVFVNGEGYRVEVTPRQKGGVDLAAIVEDFTFQCPICSDGDILPCEETEGQCSTYL
jgi:hypothetical protein